MFLTVLYGFPVVYIIAMLYKRLHSTLCAACLKYQPESLVSIHVLCEDSDGMCIMCSSSHFNNANWIPIPFGCVNNIQSIEI